MSNSNVQPISATSTPTSFLFSKESVQTVIDADGSAWFCANDVCVILDISNSRDAVSRLDDDELRVGTTDTKAGKRKANFISESGLYALIFTSNKPEARTFRKWVTSEVLPSIRKHGHYGQISAGVSVQLTQQLTRLLGEVEKANGFSRPPLLDSLRRTCMQLGQPMPDVTQLERAR